MTQYDNADFRRFCEQATDRQLANIIYSEHKNNHEVDCGIAEGVAIARGFDAARIEECKQRETP
jgi:hypothetical protein